MKKIVEISDMLKNHFADDCEAAFTDRELLVKVRDSVDKYLEESKSVCDTQGVDVAPPSNIYQVKMAKMTPQELASMGVQLISVNSSELYWVTSVGQLYAFNNKQAALEAEYAWLMSKPN